MSTILKALRRVEEERDGAPAPRPAVRGDFVARAPAQRPAQRRRRGPNFKLWGSLGTALLLAALVWWRLPRPESAEVVAAVPPPPVREAAPAPVREAAPAARAEAPAAPLPAAQAPTPPAERLARVAPRPPAADPAPEVPAAVAQRLPPLGAPLEEGAPAVPPAPAAAPPTPAPAPAATRTPPPAPQQAAPPPKPAPAPATTAAAAPVARTAPAPKPEPKAPPAPPQVQIERTSWHPTPERRIAWVRVEGLADARELREGDAVGALVVKQIRPSSVLFQYGGVEIQRRVGAR